jgi:hypothetical protein
MATPPVQIQHQHYQAVKLAQEGAPYATAKSNNEIPLSHKLRPIYQVNSDELDLYEPYWTTRGQVDISKLLNLVREGYYLKYDTNSQKNTAVKS